MTFVSTSNPFSQLWMLSRRAVKPYEPTPVLLWLLQEISTSSMSRPPPLFESVKLLMP